MRLEHHAAGVLARHRCLQISVARDDDRLDAHRLQRVLEQAVKVGRHEDSYQVALRHPREGFVRRPGVASVKEAGQILTPDPRIWGDRRQQLGIRDVLAFGLDQPCVEFAVVDRLGCVGFELAESAEAIAHDLLAGRHTGIARDPGAEKEGTGAWGFGERD